MSTRELCLRWTVDTRSRPSWQRPLNSSAVRCRSGKWRLCYCYKDGYHFLRLRKVVSDGSRPDPLDVSVQVEGGGTELSKKTHCTHDNADWWIWWRSDSEVERCCPEFRRDPHWRFVVVIRGGDADLILTDEMPACPLLSPAPTVDQTVASPRGDPCLERLSEDLYKLLDQGLQPDVEFLCAGQSTKAHGAVVSARSPVIAAMLSTDMVEGKTRVIKIPDMEPEVFNHFLRYLYTGKLPGLTFEVALKLYESGDQYGVLGLARRCVQYLMEHLSVQNACDVLVIAVAHGDGDFKEAVIDFMMVKRVPRVSDRWKDFSSSNPALAIEVLSKLWHVDP